MKNKMMMVLGMVLLSGRALAVEETGVAKADHNEVVRVTQALQAGSSGNLGSVDAKLIAKAKQAVADLMKDPGSVQFRSVKMHRAGDIRFVCGEVNARNSYGGFVGFTRFLADGVSTVVLQGAMSGYLVDLALYGSIYDEQARAHPNPAIETLCQ